MKGKLYILFCLTLLGLVGCSTQKNTWASRSFHQTKTKYNIHHNGQIAFADGLEAINEAHDDDFSTTLPLYPVSNHEAAQAATSHMDRTIEKCRKCIKLHSIKVKPKKVNHEKRRRDPNYKAWLEQEEFNNQMDKAWMLLAQAEFHKGDFLGSISTFNYIARHYAYDKDIVAQCQLWSARAYAEMDWLYEAEDVLAKVQEADLSRKNAPLYAAVSADILMKTGRYKEAIPFIKIALPNESRKVYQPRFQYVLGQLYQLQGDKKSARNAYEKVLKLQPDSEMDFNTRLQLAQLADKPTSAVSLLTKMAKQDKNKDRLDQIYGILGDIFLERKDTAKALEYYTKGIESSTKNGLNKASVLVTAGDIYYEQRDYVHASPCYKEASQILPVQHDDYKRIQRRSETLDQLVVEYSTVQLQDSLQRLATLSEAEQLRIVEKIIADLIKAEEEEAERAAQAEREAENNSGPRGVNTQHMLGGAGSGEWYFYNPQLLRSGQQTFRSQWGNRTLEDNWRRISKAATSTYIDEMADSDAVTDSISSDSVMVSATTETDNHKPEFYLQQIPKTEADFVRSNEQIANALYNMVYIYRDEVGDQALSDETFEDFCRRFPADARLKDLYYMQYLSALKDNRTTDASRYQADIIRLFPESQEAYIVSQPDYFDRLRKMSAEQDSLYETTYNAYRTSDYAQVRTNKQYVENNYPLTPLMPRFLFLNAISVAKTNGQEAFIAELRDMVARYPDNELAAMAKDMLALMGQGAESQKGGEMASLQDRRQVEQTATEEKDTTVAFSTNTNEPAVVLLVMPRDDKRLNTVLYEVALYNFSQFMIKDFDLKQLPTFTIGECALQVSGFSHLDEALWYENMLKKNADLMQILHTNEVQVICITQTNFELIGRHFTFEEYLEWAK